MKKITLEQFKNEKIAINTRTQQEYDNLMRFFDSEEIKWIFSVATAWSVFKLYEKETCLAFDGNLHYCSKKYYKEQGCKIILPTDIKEYNEYMGKGSLEFVSGEFIINERGELEVTKEENKNLTIGQAIDWMRESEENVIEYSDYNTKGKARIVDIYLNYQEEGDSKWYRISNFTYIIRHWTKIKKHIKPKKEKQKEEVPTIAECCDTNESSRTQIEILERMESTVKKILEKLS